jgi:hypothetical protein
VTESSKTVYLQFLIHASHSTVSVSDGALRCCYFCHCSAPSSFGQVPLPISLGPDRSWPSFRLARDRTEGRSRSRSSSRVRVPRNLTVTGCPAVTDGLEGDLSRLQEWPRWEGWSCSRARGRLYGAQPGAAGARGLRTAAAAVATALRRAAAAGAASSPAGARRPPSAGAHFPAVPRTRSRAARRAARSARP